MIGYNKDSPVRFLLNTYKIMFYAHGVLTGLFLSHDDTFMKCNKNILKTYSSDPQLNQNQKSD